MGIPGRKPKPAHLRALEGNPGKRPIPQAPRAAPARPNTPSWGTIFQVRWVPPVELGADGEPDQVQIAREAVRTAERQQLAKDAAAEWRRVVPVLDRLGILSTIDGAVLVDYCVCWAWLLSCQRALAREGIAVRGERGMQRNPNVTAASQYRTALRAYIAELGLGPISRGRMTLPGGSSGEDSPFDV